MSYSLDNISNILTINYLSDKLSSWFNEPIKYSGYKYVDATGKGDSYLSDVIRIIIQGHNLKDDTLQVQVILKSMPKNIARRKSFRSVDFFSNEISFYEKILPEFLKFQKLKDLSDPFDHCPRIFAMHTDGVNDFIILEDLSIYGYGGPTRQVGIDYKHCEVIINALAKFHALSIAFKDQNPEKYGEITSHIKETYYSTETWTWYERFWKRLCICAIDAVEKEYPNTIYCEKIKEFANEATFHKMVDAACNSKRYGVVNHGDMWTSNFLVKYSKPGNSPIHGKLIDFQLTRNASPILDLSFFIYACTEKDVKSEYFDSMLKLYYDKLASQVKDLGSNADVLYSFNTYMEEVRKYSFFGFAFSFESTPFIVLKPEDAIDVNSIQGTVAVNIADVWKIGPYKNAEGRIRFANNAVHAVDMGFI